MTFACPTRSHITSLSVRKFASFTRQDHLTPSDFRPRKSEHRQRRQIDPIADDRNQHTPAAGPASCAALLTEDDHATAFGKTAGATRFGMMAWLAVK